MAQGNSMRTLLTAIVGLLVAAPGGASAAVCGDPPYQWHCVINNGSAPPNPENVIDDGTHSDDWIFVRNVGCPPVWPTGGYAFDECPAPGAPSAVALTGGGVVKYLDVWDSSSVTMSGGAVEELGAWNVAALTMSAGAVNGDLYADNSSSVTVLGGTLNGDLYAYASSTVTMSGGVVTGDLLVYDDSTVAIVGRDFEVDGAPVPYGDLAAQVGTLTGTLAAGDPLENLFCQGGYMGVCTGTMTLVAPPPEYCGDGAITGSEECDDGNNDPADGCDASCQIEPGWSCVGQPSVCSRLVPTLSSGLRLALALGLIGIGMGVRGRPQRGHARGTTLGPGFGARGIRAQHEKANAENGPK